MKGSPALPFIFSSSLNSLDLQGNCELPHPQPLVGVYKARGSGFIQARRWVAPGRVWVGAPLVKDTQFLSASQPWPRAGVYYGGNGRGPGHERGHGAVECMAVVRGPGAVGDQQRPGLKKALQYAGKVFLDLAKSATISSCSSIVRRIR